MGLTLSQISGDGAPVVHDAAKSATVHRTVIMALRSARAAVTLATALLAYQQGVSAQDNAPPTMPQSPPGGAGSRPLRQMRFGVQFGGSWSAGNTNALVLNLSTRWSGRLRDDQLEASAIVNYSRVRAEPTGSPPGTEPVDVLADSNFFGQLRYDRFIGTGNTLFLGALGFRDPSSGLNARWTGRTGYSRAIVIVPARFELWVEGGYDLILEYLSRDPAAVANGLPERRWVHAPRLYVGAEWEVTELLQLDAGVEAMMNVQRPSDLRGNAIVQASTRIGGSFRAGVNYTLRYLHDPIGDRAPFDSSLQLVVLMEHDTK